MASTHAAGRGAQTMHIMYFKPVLRKAYHRKSGSPDMVGDKMKPHGEEVKHRSREATGNGDSTWWVRDERTGIFYPKGQEKVIEDVPKRAGKDYGTINWFA